MLNFVYLFLFLLTSILASPERYDHLAKYKVAKVKSRGPLKEKVYDSSNVLISEAEYFYNKQKQLIRADYKKDQMNDGFATFQYSRNGVSVENLFNTENTLIEKIIYKYNWSGNIVLYKLLNPSQKQILHWQFQWKNNKLTSGKRIINRKVTESFIFKKENNHPLRKNIYSTTGESVGWLNFIYSNNMLLSREKVDYNGRQKVNYKYDTKGRLIEMNYFKLFNNKSNLVKKHTLYYEANEFEKSGLEG